ncbi:MAG TPA: oxidoreductase [Desulfobacteraceae bacterium]|nr:oxidoreductase [Desulfobacteraceae bacterium]
MDLATHFAERLFCDVEMFRSCEQCGLCSSACPLTGTDGFNIRRILRYVELGLVAEIAGTRLPWICTTCGRCEGVCPNGIAVLGIIRPLRALGPEEFVPESAPCAAACPAGIDVPEYVRLIAAGDPSAALSVIAESVPFPGVLGRVCTHPCELECRRGEVNQAVSICALKRFAADQVGEDLPIHRAGADTGRSVGIVGAGPAGLAAAWFLRRKGHEVRVFEAREKAGGMLRYGIPAYRLPEDVLDREISGVLSLGVELKCGMKLGEDFELERLKKDYDAVLITVGLWRSRRLPLEGAELDGVLRGLEFLISSREGGAPETGQNLVVVGGGNVAVDVALTALRLGAGRVTMACLETLEEMPASPRELEIAVEEGVEVLPSWGPCRIFGDNGCVTGVELVRCTSVFDEKGAFCPMFGEESREIKADRVILAVGQQGDMSFVGDDQKLVTAEGLIAADQTTLRAGMNGVFAAGDAVSGPGTVVEAIAAGKRAGAEIDRFLGGDGMLEASGRKEKWDGSYDGKRPEGFPDQVRGKLPAAPLEERRKTFVEIDRCFSAEQAVKEASRCLQCDLEIRLAMNIRKNM